ncbi:polysaccharide pyruvyl transferase family protein [Naumannella halotolerans]|uniref:Polysaccharide pyruvyl transferase WcaK-like protein n=1 Tax=Naumannella halotolerans TaxID=993414 RepID=A0A4R7IZ06_9ACTN|nr:polysaccharide pyruvyl transferase family protein [Naumannella halotolerans]TDT29960.1 polysaccharide pyruvyl transferase WcaK-like protein [Naumannella halotolerans]
MSQAEPPETSRPEPSKESLEGELRGLLKPRVGVTGSYARGNYGDELYVRVFEHWLGQWADLTLLTGIFRPEYFRGLRNAQVDLMDAVVLGGGDLLCPYRPKVDPDFINPMYLRRPVHVAGIGVELNRTDIDESTVGKWKRFLTDPNIRSISTRDPRSAEWIIEHISPNVPVSSHPDLVCALPLPPAPRPDGAPVLGLVTRHIKHPKEYVLMAEVSRRLIEQGWRVRHIIGGVAGHGRKDFENAAELKVEGKETCYTENLDDISRALGECSLVLSMKLHTTLVATMYGVPTISMNPVAKARAFMRSIDREDLALPANDRRVFDIIEGGVPEVPMDKVAKLRADAIDSLKSLSRKIWDDHRNQSSVRQSLLPGSPGWFTDAG